jgi:Nif-specific regulatory protein
MLNVDAQRFETLIEINELINTDFQDGRSLLTRILDSATRLTGGEASSLLLVNPDNGKLYFEIALGPKGPELSSYTLNMGEGIAGWVAEHNRSLIVNDVTSDDRFNSEISKKIGFSTRAILAVPMRSKNHCIGVIEIINKKEGLHFSQDDLQWLEIFSNQAAIALQNAKEYERIISELDRLKSKIEEKPGFHPFIGSGETIQKKLELARKIGKTGSSVLIIGESGTGKELFAEQIHLAGGRSKEPFIRVNCAAIPDSLIESELFGHVKGAFTDAFQDRTGRFEKAHGGSLFLDEVGELPLSTQAKLLRVLQSGRFEPLGSSESVNVDVRIVAASNRDLEAAMDQGTFREDLYYRLNVLPLTIPPLREHPEDISELANFFLDRYRGKKKIIEGFSSEALEALLSYRWPGNIRELENTIERAVVISRGNYILSEDLMLPGSFSNKGDDYHSKSLREAVWQFKKHFICTALDEHNWNQTETAKAIGIQRTYLSKLIKELEISR